MNENNKEALELLISELLKKARTDRDVIDDVKTLIDADVSDYKEAEAAYKNSQSIELEQEKNRNQTRIDEMKIEVEKAKLEFEQERNNDHTRIEEMKIEVEKAKLESEEKRGQEQILIEEARLALEKMKLVNERENRKAEEKSEFRRFVLNCIIEPLKIVGVGVVVPVLAIRTEQTGGFIHRVALQLVPKMFNK